MQVQSLNFASFGAKYKTEDVLRFITQYPYKQKGNMRDFVLDLTGSDISSDEFISKIDKDANPFFAQISVYSQCHDKILARCPELKEADESFDCMLHLKKSPKEQDNWFKLQLAKLPKELDIRRFKLNIEQLRKEYRETIEIFNKIF